MSGKNEILNKINELNQKEFEKEVIKNDISSTLVAEIELLSRKMDVLISKMEQLEKKYSNIIDEEISLTSQKQMEPAEVTGETEIYNTLYRLAEKVYNVIYQGNISDENERLSYINNITYELYYGSAERYMNYLNEMLVANNISREDYVAIEKIIEELADYSVKSESKEQNSNTVVGDNNEAVKEEGNIDTEPLNSEISYFGSGNMFISWINTQNFDNRIKSALASIEYIFDEITRKESLKLIKTDKNIIGIQNGDKLKLYDNGTGRNRISNILIDINEILNGSSVIQEKEFMNCYDIVRTVEREETKARKGSAR